MIYLDILILVLKNRVGVVGLLWNNWVTSNLKMKLIPLINIAILIFIACQPNKQKSDMVIEKDTLTSTNEYKIDTTRLLKNRLSINFDSKNKSFVTDTLYELNYKYIAFGTLDEIDFSLGKTINYYLDSIYVLIPIESKLKLNIDLDGETMDFFDFEDRGLDNDKIIISDINGDGKKDFGIRNEGESGNGQNLTYDYWINNGYTLKYNREFSLPNLRYENKVNEYYSRLSGGGGNRTETYYKYKSGKLIPLRSLDR
ncbi:MAG TPA: hypothetical protein PJ990_20110, partial [Saprospiraceae bacterium]|nr:hypothetical protein [Saprospiraceae bacterium]